LTLFRISNIGTTLINDARVLNSNEKIGKKSFSLKQGNVEVHLDDSGNLDRISKGDKLDFSVSYEFGYYKSFPGDASDTQASGAYIFRNIPGEDFIKILPDPSKTIVRQTPLQTEVHIKFEVPWVNQVIKVYKDKNYVDIDFTVGPIDVSNGIGKEVVTRFVSSIENDGVFFTDSNGREFLKRKRSQRNTWTLEEFEPIAGNYYPVNAAIYIEDTKAFMGILTDRSQGGASLKDGSVELMVHRRTLHDDARGVDEAMNETDYIAPYPPFGDASRKGNGLIITGTHRLVLGFGNDGFGQVREQMDEMFMPIHLFTGAAQSPLLFGSKSGRTSKSALTEPFEKNVQLTTIKTLSVDRDITTFLLRLGHAFGDGESDSLSKPVTIDLSKLFVEIINISETTLTGNRKKENWVNEKMRWQHTSNESCEGIVCKRETTLQ